MSQLLPVEFLTTTKSKFETLTPEKAFYIIRDDEDETKQELYFGGKKLDNTQEITDTIAALSSDGGAIKAIKDVIDKLDGDENVSGSVKEQLKTAVDGIGDILGDVPEDSTVMKEIQGAVDGLVGSAGIASKDDDGRVTLKAGVSETSGKIGNTTGEDKEDIVLEKVATTGKAEDVSVEDTGNKIDATNVEAALVELAGKIENAGIAGKVTVETPSSNEYASVYKFYQGVADDDDEAAKAAKNFITINVTKDKAIKTVELVDITFDEDDTKLYDGETDVTEYIKNTDTPTASDAGKYLKVTIENDDETVLYVNLSYFVDVYEGVNGSEINITVDSDNKISAVVNKVSASKVVYKEAVEADPDNEVEAQAEETVQQALARIDNAIGDGGSVEQQIQDAIAAALVWHEV